MENFTPILSTIGGLLIGLSAGLMMLGNGRIAGISGIFRGTIQPAESDWLWRALFVAGLVASGGIMFMIRPEWFAISIDRSLFAIAAAGLLVGFGTRLGNGCTSGHGVCGLSRFSIRSLVATLSFMGTGALVVFVINHLLGGSI